MNMEETAPTPSASSNVLGKGFNTLDYILCLSYRFDQFDVKVDSTKLVGWNISLTCQSYRNSTENQSVHLAKGSSRKAAKPSNPLAL